jgi:hypothetical protein
MSKRNNRKNILARKSSGDHQVKITAEEKTQARGPRNMKALSAATPRLS